MGKAKMHAPEIGYPESEGGLLNPEQPRLLERVPE